MKIARAALAAPVLLLAVGCGASPSSDDSASTASLAEPAADMALLYDASASGGTAAVAPGETAKAPPAQSKAIISKGQVSLESEDPDEVRFELQKLLTSWDGAVDSEESSADEEGRTERQQLVLRVPSDKFGAAMDAISGLGTLVDRNRSSEDVTTQVIDVAARVRSQRLSLARVQALLARASTINQVIAIESQLSTRQAELDSLVQQQKYLADQTSESTITVFLNTPAAAEEDSEEASGFVAGLRDGWDAFTTAATGSLQGLGAVLPFAAVIALVGLPARALWRRRQQLT